MPKQNARTTKDISRVGTTGPYIDESGLTSLEPEGAGHFRRTDEDAPDSPEAFRRANDRHEGCFGCEPNPDAAERDGDDAERGIRPIVGDAEGAPTR